MSEQLMSQPPLPLPHHLVARDILIPLHPLDMSRQAAILLVMILPAVKIHATSLFAGSFPPSLMVLLDASHPPTFLLETKHPSLPMTHIILPDVNPPVFLMSSLLEGNLLLGPPTTPLKVLPDGNNPTVHKPPLNSLPPPAVLLPPLSKLPPFMIRRGSTRLGPPSVICSALMSKV